MEGLMLFVSANWASIAIVIGFIFMCFVMVKRGYKKNVAMWIYILVTKAEENFGSGTGSIKYAEVLGGVYEKFPNVIKVFFSLDEIDDMIENSVDALQEWLLAQSE